MVDVSDFSNDELADLIHNLTDALHVRFQNIDEPNWLKRELEIARLSVRSWGTTQQREAGAR